MKTIDCQSSKDLLNLIDENFYTTFPNAEAYFVYLNKLLEILSLEHNLNSPPKISFFVDSPINIASCIRKKIKLNKALYEMFDKCKSDNNLYYIFSSIDAIFHEFRHYLQHCAKDGEISGFIKTSSKALYKISNTYCDLKIPYNNSPTEVDARYFAYNHLKDCKILSQFYSSNLFKKEEMQRHSSQSFSVLMLLDYIAPVVLPWNKKVMEDWERELSNILSKRDIDYSKLKDKYKNFRNEIEKIESEEIYANIAPEFAQLKLHKQNAVDKKLTKSFDEYALLLYRTCYEICQRERPDLIIHEEKSDDNTKVLV